MNLRDERNRTSDHGVIPIESEVNMEIKVVPMRVPDGANLILGQTHFIKTVEDLYEGPDDVKRRREFLRKIGYKL